MKHGTFESRCSALAFRSGKTGTRLFLLATICMLWGCKSETKQDSTNTAVSLPVLTLQEAQISTYQEYPATIEGVDNLEIRPQISGILEKIFVDEGAYVHAGQPLFKINEQQFRAALNNAEASLQTAQGVLMNANLEVEKLSPLVANNVVSDYQLKAAKASVEVAKGDVEQAKANIASAKINLGYTLIAAPVSGYISRLPRKKGSLVSPADAEPLTQLSDNHNVRVYFSLSEGDFVTFKENYAGETLAEKIKNLPPVSLLLDGSTVYDNQGKIDVIDGQFDKGTGSIMLRVTFPNPNGLLRTGNTGKIQLPLVHENAIAIPASATVEMQDKVFVFALDEKNTVKKQEVIIKGKNGQDYIVQSGLSSGDRIVISGIGSLQDGTVVQPKTAEK